MRGFNFIFVLFFINVNIIKKEVINIPTISSTTISTIIPTIIPTTIPTTIPTIIPTIIPTTIPTTISTIIPTAIPTTIPTTILTTIPTTILTTIPATIQTTIPTIITTFLNTISLYDSTEKISEAITFEEFGIKFLNYYLLSNNDLSKIIIGSDFNTLIKSLDNSEFMNQIQFYNSSIDLGFCPQMLKNYYNISQNETLITLITELKDNNIKNKQKSLNLGIKILVNIFDSSGRKLDLSHCKDNI